MKLVNVYGISTDLAIYAPTVQAFNIEQIDNESVQFERGNGSKYIAVIGSEEINPALILDGISYSLGQVLSDGSKIIARGTSTSIDISDLAPGSYFLRIFEYNGFGGFEKYNRSAAVDNPAIIVVESEEDLGIFDFSFDETFE